MHHRIGTRRVFPLTERLLPAELLGSPDPNETDEDCHSWDVPRRVGSLGLAPRRDLDLNGYVESWAVYAERLAWEMGLCEDDAQGNLGRLQLELARAARLVIDTGIHARGWTRQEAATGLR